MNLTRKQLFHLMHNAKVLSLDGVPSWILEKSFRSDSTSRDTALRCSQIHDSRELMLRVADLVNRPVTANGVATPQGAARFFELKEINVEP